MAQTWFEVDGDADRRRRAAAPFLVIGYALVVAGGLVAAVTHPTGFELGSWTAAYLVLVGGVAQATLGGAQAWLARGAPSSSVVRLELVLWNSSVAAVLVGTLAGLPWVTSLGGVVVVAALVVFLVGVPLSPVSPRWAVAVFRGLILFVLLSAPVGLVLAWIRRG
jgi:hypothetical protein